MPDEELAGLSPRELVALMWQLEARLQAVVTELAAAQARIAELEAELARRSGPVGCINPGCLAVASAGERLILVDELS